MEGKKNQPETLQTDDMVYDTEKQCFDFGGNPVKNRRPEGRFIKFSCKNRK